MRALRALAGASLWLGLAMGSEDASWQLPIGPAGPTAASDWTYYCFRGAELYAAADPARRFRALPNSADVLGIKPVASHQQADGERAAEPRQPLQSDATSGDVQSKLSALTGTCFFWRTGYWTYEVCPGQRVRQYHSENALSGAAKVRTEYSLGAYEATADEYVSARRLYAQVRRGARGSGRWRLPPMQVCPRESRAARSCSRRSSPLTRARAAAEVLGRD